MGTNSNIQECAEGRKFEEWLGGLLSEIRGEKADITALVYDAILKEKKPEDAFRFFLENADDITSSEEVAVEQVFTNTELQKLQRKFGSLIGGILDSLLAENDSEQEFYNRLWNEGVCGNTFLKNDKDRIYALYRIWRDDRIPYFHLDEGLTMPNEQFQQCCAKNKYLIKKAFFIISSSFSQRTQQSDLLLKLLSECETNEERAVVLAQILGNVEKRVVYSFYEAIGDGKTED